MKNSIARACGFGLIGVLFLASIEAAEPQTIAQAARAPRDARQLQNRTDLTTLFTRHPQIRIIVGLQTEQETGAIVAGTPDHLRQQTVASRQARVLERLRGLNVSSVKRLRFHPFIAMTVDSQALGAVLADPEVTSVSEDGIIYPLLSETGSITRATSAWADGFRGVGQTVAVIDSGVDPAHQFFEGKVVGEACFSNPGPGSTSLCPNGQPQQIGSGAGVHCPDFEIGCWHGTHVAGIAAGNYGQLSSTSGGVAHGANVMPIQVFQKDCSSGKCQLVAYYSDIMISLEHVYDQRNAYRIAAANLSLGGMNSTATCDNEAPGVTAVIQSLRAAGIATVVASGNAGIPNAISFPACITDAISVGATTKQNAVTSFSNSASFLSLLAPGENVTSSVPDGGYALTDGTSLAAPHVSGAWATLKSAKPTATVTEVLQALTTAGLAITDSRNGLTKPLIQIGDSPTQLGALGLLLGRDLSSSSEIVIDNAAPGVANPSGGQTSTGAWCTALPWNEFGADALTNCTSTAAATYRWTPTIPTAGTWDVYVWWSAQPSQSANASITVVSAVGPVAKTFDQRTGGGQWVLHGRYAFDAGAAGYVEVSNSGAGHVSADAVRFVKISDAPPLATVTIAARDALAAEAGLDTGVLIVMRTGSTATDLTVQYTVNGTATAGTDYIALSGTVVIPAGASSATITITPIDDALVEAKETVIVALSAGSGYTVGTTSTSKVTITSDDVSG